MIVERELLIFKSGEQEKFLRDVKLALRLTWKEIFPLIGVSRAMLYFYLNETSRLNREVFRALIKKSGLKEEDYSFKIKSARYNKAEICSKKSEDFCELIGILLGDGHISKINGCVTISLNSELEERYKNERIIPLINSLFKIRPLFRKIKNKRNIQVFLYSEKVLDFLTNLGLPSGKRTLNPRNKIPNFIFQDKRLLKACLRGLFDSEGSLSHRHHRAIRLSIYNNSPFLLSSIFKAFKKLGYNSIRKEYSVRLNRTSEIRRFFREIGTRNPYKRNIFNHWITCGELPKVHTAVL